MSTSYIILGNIVIILILWTPIMIVVSILIKKAKNKKRQANSSTLKNNENAKISVVYKVLESMFRGDFLTPNKQISNFLKPEEFDIEYKNNFWIKTYYETIKKFATEVQLLTHIIRL